MRITKINITFGEGWLFTWPNQDGQMIMTEIREHEQKIDQDEC